MPEESKGPISDKKAMVSIPPQEVEKAFSGTILQEIFVATEERPSVPVSARIPPSLDRLINELLVHPAFPWSDKSDFLRNAAFIVAKGITLLFKNQGFNVDKMMPFLSKLEALRLEAMRKLALKQTIDTMGDVDESVEAYMKEEAWDDLLGMLEEYAKILNEMPDGFWAQTAIVKFFIQSNVAKAIGAFRAKKVQLPPNLELALKKFRGLRR